LGRLGGLLPSIANIASLGVKKIPLKVEY